MASASHPPTPISQPPCVKLAFTKVNEADDIRQGKQVADEESQAWSKPDIYLRS